MIRKIVFQRRAARTITLKMCVKYWVRIWTWPVICWQWCWKCPRTFISWANVSSILDFSNPFIKKKKNKYIMIKRDLHNPNFFQNIVTGNETWYYQYKQLTKRLNSIWKSLYETRQKTWLVHKDLNVNRLLCIKS